MAEQTLTAKLQIYPTDTQKEKLWKTMQQYRDAANLISRYIFMNQFQLSQFKLQSVLYSDIRSTFHLKSQAAVECIRDVIARYKTVQTQLAQKPYRYKDSDGKWKSVQKTLDWLHQPLRFHTPQVALSRNRSYRFKDGGAAVSVTTSFGTCAMRLNWTHRETLLTDPSVRLGEAKVLRQRRKWFLAISYTQTVPDFDKETVQQVVGLDRGLNFLATSYDSREKTKFFNGRAIMDRRHHYKQLRRHLQMHNTKSARRRIHRIEKRENRWMSDVNHQISKTLVSQYGPRTLFALEDLTNVRFATEQLPKKRRYEAVSWSFFQLEQFLGYKAAQVGGTVFKVDARYTSQRCPKCGAIRKANRDHKRHLYHCAACGYTSNDDRLAAINIQQLGTWHVSGVAHPSFAHPEDIFKIMASPV